MIRRIATAGAMPIVLLALALALSGAAPMADAQPPQKARRIGFLIAGWPNSDIQEVFVQGMRELGWVPGRNVDIEFRFAEGNDERLAALAADLARKNVEIIVAAGTRSASVASKATRSIPIVMLNASDPARIGLVASLAQPAGNVTGTAYTVGSETFGKGLALLREVIPGIRHVAILSNPANPAQPLAIENIKLTAQSLGLRLLLFEAKRAAELDDVFAAIAKERADALLVVPEALFIQKAPRLTELALKHRLPTVFGTAEDVVAGGLMSYGPSLAHGSRRGAMFVDRILKGAKPADLPVEQPTKFELAINLRTAKTLGLTVSPSLLLRADRVIE
jgi:putative ABC transport system substrate-binding protein